MSRARMHAAHADKNAHRPEEAAERFKEIQNAWEVLSDKHERAWCVSCGGCTVRWGGCRVMLVMLVGYARRGRW